MLNEAATGPLCPVWDRSNQHIRDNDKLGWVEWRTPNGIGGVALISVLQFLEGKIPCRESRARFFLEVHSDGQEVAPIKLQYGRFWLDVREKIFAVSIVNYWSRLLRGAVDSPSKE